VKYKHDRNPLELMRTASHFPATGFRGSSRHRYFPSAHEDSSQPRAAPPSIDCPIGSVSGSYVLSDRCPNHLRRRFLCLCPVGRIRGRQHRNKFRFQIRIDKAALSAFDQTTTAGPAAHGSCAPRESRMAGPEGNAGIGADRRRSARGSPRAASHRPYGVIAGRSCDAP
jgi:hypothetical protein